MKSPNLITLAVIAALAIGVFVWFRTNTKKLFKMAEFRVKGIKFGKMEGINIPVDVNIEIFNPSDFAVPVKSYKVEIHKKLGSKTELLSTSNVASVNIPANGTILNKITFNVNILQVLDTAISAFSWDLDLDKIASDVQSELAGKVMLKVYAEVYNQFIEREINL